jgi:hypothetical protein
MSRETIQRPEAADIEATRQTLETQYAKSNGDRNLLQRVRDRAMAGIDSLKQKNNQRRSLGEGDSGVLDAELVEENPNTSNNERTTVEGRSDAENNLQEGLLALRDDEAVPDLPEGRREQLMQKIGEIITERRKNWADLTPAQKAAVCALALVAVGAISGTILLGATALGWTSFASIGMGSHVFGMGISGVALNGGVVGANIGVVGGIGGMGKLIVGSAAAISGVGAAASIYGIVKQFGMMQEVEDEYGMVDVPEEPEPQDPEPLADLEPGINPDQKILTPAKSGDLEKIKGGPITRISRPGPISKIKPPESPPSRPPSPVENLPKLEESHDPEAVSKILDSILSKYDTTPHMVHDFQLREGVQKMAEGSLAGAKSVEELARLQENMDRLFKLLKDQVRQRIEAGIVEAKTNNPTKPSNNKEILQGPVQEQSKVDLGNPEEVLEAILLETGKDVSELQNSEIKSWCNAQSALEMAKLPPDSAPAIASKFRRLYGLLVGLAEQRRSQGQNLPNLDQLPQAPAVSSQQQTNERFILNQLNQPKPARMLPPGPERSNNPEGEIVDELMAKILLLESGPDFNEGFKSIMDNHLLGTLNSQRSPDGSLSDFRRGEIENSHINIYDIIQSDPRFVAKLAECELVVRDLESTLPKPLLGEATMSKILELKDGEYYPLAIKKGVGEMSPGVLMANNSGEISLVKGTVLGSELANTFGKELFDVKGILEPNSKYRFTKQPKLGLDGRIIEKGILEKILPPAIAVPEIALVPTLTELYTELDSINNQLQSPIISTEQTQKLQGDRTRVSLEINNLISVSKPEKDRRPMEPGFLQEISRIDGEDYISNRKDESKGFGSHRVALDRLKNSSAKGADQVVGKTSQQRGNTERFDDVSNKGKKKRNKK